MAAPYNAANSAGSNLGPTSQALLDRVKADIAALKASTGTVEIPADAVTASASGLDPHLSPAFALLQVGRIAKARHLPPDRLRQLVTELTVGPILGILGKPRLNVLRLNLALDALPAT